MQDIKAVMDYFAGARVFGIRPGLERIKALLARLGNPQEKIPAVHIAGTNGKGSVSAFITAIAAYEGYRVGWYTSPYLENFNERIRVIDRDLGFRSFLEQPRSAEITDLELITAVRAVKEAADSMEAEGLEAATEFELITATAFYHFAQSGCNLMVLETGLGGRLDATNVISKSLVSVITALGYDHTDRLGKHLQEIAAEKAGIIKTDCPLVLLNPQVALDKRGEAGEAAELIRQVAKAKNSQLNEIFASDLEFLPKERNEYTQSFIFRGDPRPYKIKLLAEYQVYNAALAIAAAQHFASEESIRQGLYEARWPGRFEFLAKEPPLLIDGAHNLQGTLGLRAELERYFAGEELIFFTGILEDKEHQAMLESIFADSPYKVKAVFIAPPPVPRAFDPRALAEELKLILPEAKIRNFEELSLDSLAELESPEIFYTDDYNVMAKSLPKISKDLGLGLIAFGSLYLIGNSRPLLRESLSKLAK